MKVKQGWLVPLTRGTQAAVSDRTTNQCRGMQKAAPTEANCQGSALRIAARKADRGVGGRGAGRAGGHREQSPAARPPPGEAVAAAGVQLSWSEHPH